MFSVAKLKRKPQHFRSFSGLSVSEFETLLVAVTPIYGNHRQEGLARDDRARSLGGGRKFRLGLAERLLMTLMSRKLYVENTVLGYLFDLDESNVGREINQRMQPALIAILPLPAQDDPGLVLVSGQKPKKIRTLAELLEKHPEFKEVLLDASEQEVPKPKAKLARQQRYSGKHKKHTIKFQIASSNKLILHLSRYVPGALHDHTLLRATGLMHHLKHHIIRVDKGYDNLEAEFPEHLIQKPKKARRNQPLNPLDKIINQLMSRLRMPVKHCFLKLKSFKLLAGIYRGQLHFYDDTLLLIAGLCNFKTLGSLTW